MLWGCCCGMVACLSGVRHRPCSELGQPARENSRVEAAVKKCFQIKDEKGQWVNHGKYYEWDESDKIVLTGEYKMGRKQGRWLEYDRQGNRVSDRHFENGVELSP